jgi:hypothetical protein
MLHSFLQFQTYFSELLNSPSVKYLQHNEITNTFLRSRKIERTNQLSITAVSERGVIPQGQDLENSSYAREFPTQRRDNIYRIFLPYFLEYCSAMLSLNR